MIVRCGDLHEGTVVVSEGFSNDHGDCLKFLQEIFCPSGGEMGHVTAGCGQGVVRAWRYMPDVSDRAEMALFSGGARGGIRLRAVAAGTGGVERLRHNVPRAACLSRVKRQNTNLTNFSGRG